MQVQILRLVSKVSFNHNLKNLHNRTETGMWVGGGGVLLLKIQIAQSEKAGWPSGCHLLDIQLCTDMAIVSSTSLG